MNKMIQLARKGVLKMLLVLLLCFAIPVSFLVLVISSVEEATVVLSVLGFSLLLIMLIFGLIGWVPIFRLKRSIRLQEVDYGSDVESEWEDPEQITKNCYMTKNWILSTYYGYIFAIHRKAIENVEEDIYYQRHMRYPMISFTLENKKKHKLVFSKRKEFDATMDALERWFPKTQVEMSFDPVTGETMETTTVQSRVSRKELHQSAQPESFAKFFGFLACSIALVAIFGFGYSWLMGNRPTAASKSLTTLIKESENPQRKILLKSLERKKASNDDLQTTIDSSEDGYYVAIFNDTEYFFNGELQLYKNKKVIATLDCVMLKPGEYSIVMGEYNGKPDGYGYMNGEFYYLPQGDAGVKYQLLYDYDEYEEWYDVMLSTANMDENTVIDIAKAEYYKNVVSDITYEILYFYDDSAELIVEDEPYSGYNKETGKYSAIIDSESQEISLYVIANGQETLLETLSMAK